jgi:hypothetical protein
MRPPSPARSWRGGPRAVHDPPFIECIDDTSCGLHDGGHCLANAATGHSFCAYPDPACVGGLRWSDYDVEDSISGTCVAAAPCLARFAFEAGDDVWVANADGTGLRNVSVSTFVDVAPQWSPTADRIAFESSRAGMRLSSPSRRTGPTS